MKNSMLFLTVFLGVMTAMAPLSTDMYLPSLPEIGSAFSISTSMVQLTLTMTMLGMSLGQILGGPVSDRLGRKVPLFIGMVGFTLASLVCSFTENIYIFLAARFVQGLAGAFGIVIARAVARDVVSGPELMKFMALLMMVNGLAPIAAPVFGAQILRFTTWHGIFEVLVVVGVIQILVTAFYKETLQPANRVASFTEGFGAFGTLLKNRYFLGQCLLQCFYFGSFFAYIAGSSFLFQNVYEVSAQTYSYIFGGIGLGLMAMGVLPAQMSRTVREITFLKWSLIAPCITSLFFLGGILLDAPIWYTLLVLFFTIVPLSAMGAASTSLALSRCGKNAGSASALLGFFNMILGGVMMPVTGIAGDHTAVPMAVLMVMGYFLSLVVFYKMIVEKKGSRFKVQGSREGAAHNS